MPQARLTRQDFQELTRVRLREARRLLEAKCFGGAYYLTELALECALKACIAKHTRRYEFPDLHVVRNSWKHDLSKLLKTAGLVSELDRDAKKNAALEGNWAVAKDWSVDTRYQIAARSDAQRRANDLYRAVTTRRNGVLAWLRQHW
jgi:HEPN domain-containing protein